jgi:hypothetical protein
MYLVGVVDMGGGGACMLISVVERIRSDKLSWYQNEMLESGNVL